MSVKETAPTSAQLSGRPILFVKMIPQIRVWVKFRMRVPLSLTSTSALMGSRIIAASSASLTTMC